MTDAARALASDPANIRLARKLAGSFARKLPWQADELESAALLGLCRAAITFDPDGGASWKNHLYARARGEILDALRGEELKGHRRNSPHRHLAPRVASLSVPIESDPDGRSTTLGQQLASDNLPIGWEAEYQDEVEGLARRLPRRYGDVVRLHYGRAEARTPKGAGRVLGLCESRVSQILLRATLMIREAERYRATRARSADEGRAPR